MKTIYLDFCHSGPKMPKQENYFYRLLTKRFDVQLVDQPDFLIIGTEGRFREDIYTCTKIFYTYEHYLPDFGKHDYALTCNYLDDPRHYRLPIYVHFGLGGPETLIKHPGELEAIMAQKTKFCALVTGNVTTPTTKTRTNFFHKLSKYKKVDSGGCALNNIGQVITRDRKREFLQPYKFSIAFENESRVGYTSEKIFDAMQGRGVPLYWGNPRVKDEFNPKSFLNYFDFESEDALIEKIIELDQDDAKYFEYLKEPYFYNNEPSEAFNEMKQLDFFEEIFSKPITPVSKRRSFFFGRWILVKKDR
jgi:hypothetical protein